MQHVDLFAGLGGFSLAARWMGWETIAWCEINHFCQTVLKYHFPKAAPHEDIKATDFSIYRGKCDILTGGFPCQPFSVSGEQGGAKDVRYLYPEMLRAVREVKPKWIVAENVRGLTSRKFAPIFEDICSSLEAEGYEIFPPLLIPASAIGANHERYRIWFIAHANGERLEGVNNKICNESESLEVAVKTLAPCQIGFRAKHKLPKPFVVGRNNGLPLELDNITFSKWREGSISGFGNAIVPSVAYEIFKAIEKFEQIKQ